MNDTPADPGTGSDHVMEADVPAAPAVEADNPVSRVPPPCCHRLAGGGWCLLPDGHPGDQHEGIATKK